MATIALLGAAGRTGRLIITQAQQRGLKVRALARDPAKLSGVDVEMVKGDARDEAALRQLFTGVDAVVSAMGATKITEGGIQSKAMGPIVTAMRACGVRRYVALTSAAARLPGEKFPFLLGAMNGVFGAFFRAYAADKKAEVDALVASDLEWTLLRVPAQLVDGEGGSLALSLQATGLLVRPAQRQAVAAALLDAVVEKKWIRQAPFAPGAK